jgi:non-heme chloroperoxidase
LHRVHTLQSRRAGSELTVLAGAPHGCNVSHPEEFNRALLDFLAK